MDPLHITEFASQRYFQKIDQLPKEQQQESNVAETSPSSSSSLQQQPQPQQQSQFILPLRQVDQHQPQDSTKPSEQKRPEKEKEKEKEKRSLFSLGRLRSSKPVVPVLEPQDVRRPSVASVGSIGPIPEAPVVKQRSSLRFDQLFLALPNELQVQVIASLPLSDILNLRLASRSWHEMVTMNEAPIVRYHLDHQIPSYALRLYPIPDSSGWNFHYLCSIWHRLHVAAKLAELMCEWITKEIFLRTTTEQKAGFSGQKERMRRRLIPLLFTVFHFFETYRALHLQYIKEHGHGIERTPYTLNPIEVQIMSMYDDRTLLHVHQIFPLVISSFCRRLRPPSYVGRVERTVRGYIREKPPDEVHVAVLCLGGLRQVERIWEIKGFNSRVGAVDSWYNSIREVKEPKKPLEPHKDAKPKRGFRGLGRKKSQWQVRDVAKSQESSMGPDTLEQTPTRTWSTPPSLVFNTSLAAGMPMGQLDSGDYKTLLEDLPILQKLWLTTAEALILDRKIVERPVDIKRNAQVMLDLIKEEGIAEEDEWWYGKHLPDSVRPPLEAIEEDLLE